MLDQRLIHVRQLDSEGFLEREQDLVIVGTADQEVIMEPGASYGRLAYFCRRMMTDLTYVILSLTRSATDIGRDQLQRGKVHLFLPHKIEAIRPDTADAFVNIYSFAETPVASIRNYFNHLDRITSGVLYRKQRAPEVNAFDGSRIDEFTYPIPAHWRRLFRGDTSLYDGFLEVA